MQLDPTTRKKLEQEALRRGMRLEKFPEADKAEVMPFYFHDGQKAVWDDEEGLDIVACAGSQGGKALCADTPIPTPHGFTKMRDIQIGDYVFDEWGRLCKVLLATDVYMSKRCFRLEFDDGTTIDADGEHRWWATSYRERKNAVRRVVPCEPEYRIVTTEEMFAEITERGEHSNWEIPLAPEIHFVGSDDLELDPYCLGAWLGDGHSASSRFTNADQEVIERIKDAGYQCLPSNDQNSGKATTYIIGNKVRCADGRMRYDFASGLRSYSLIGNKHIPEVYLTARLTERLALLRGLMDTDGYCDARGHAEFCSKNERLANDVAELVRSLGMKCRVRVNPARLYGKDCGLRHRVCFRPSENVFTIARKTARIKPGYRKDLFKRYVRNIVEIEPKPVKCISVSSKSKLYLAGRNYVVTHNTDAAPSWLLREIKRTAKYGAQLPTKRASYVYAGPSLELLANQAIPKFESVFVHEWGLGRLYRGNKPVFHFSKEGANRLCGVEIPISVIFAYASDSSNLESVTALGGVWDEAGQQDNKLASYRAFNRRLKLARSLGKELGIKVGRRLFTTTPYEWGWFKDFVVDPAMRGDEGMTYHNWPSWWNPMVSEEECRAELEMGMPIEEWQMMYMGMYTRPRGKVYDCWNFETNTCDRFEIPDEWPRAIGVDFGANNTAAVMLAKDKANDRWILYKTYHAGGKTIREHVQDMTDGMSSLPIAAGGNHTEDGVREAYQANGLWIREPYENNVELQIRIVYAAIKTGKLVVFNDLDKFLYEMSQYSRELDDYGNPTDKIRNKSIYHRLDALRYIATVIFQDMGVRIEGPGFISRYNPNPEVYK